MLTCRNPVLRVAPVVTSVALLLAACGSSGNSASVAQAPAAAPVAATDTSAAAPAAAAPAAAAPAAAAADAAPAAAPAAKVAAPAAGTTKPTKPTKATKATTSKVKTGTNNLAAPAPVPVLGHAAGAGAGAGAGADKVKSTESASDQAANQKIYDEKQGVTDVGITKDSIHLGSVNMHGMALGNVLTAPQVRGNMASITAINDRGGVLGRRMTITDCDDGPGEVSRAKACIKKLAVEDHVFSLVTGLDWATASIHDDLKEYHLPYMGAWAYSQTEWQDPYMFPTHMSMVNEAFSGAHWVANNIHPKTYGLVCLTSPEMQIACNNVSKILDATGAKLVKRLDVSIAETSMSANVLAMRAANPDHIIHYVINPSTMAKFMVEAAQQSYYPPMGISGNHLAAEVLGSLFGKWPTNRYWTNTTYKLWGPEFMAIMNKYARGNAGTNHHIVQAGYAGINIFAQAAKAVGPNLTQQRLMAQLSNGTVWATDASLDQKFSWARSERLSPEDIRAGTLTDQHHAQGREFMYKYTSTNTTSNPDGSPSGFQPDDKQFILTTSGQPSS